MKLLKNQGTDRVIDELRASLTAGGSIDAASPDLTLFAFGELRDALRRLSGSRLIVPTPQADAQRLLGSDADRGSRNQLSAHKHARDFAEWLRKAVEVKVAPGPLPQATLVAKNSDGTPAKFISGNCPLTTDGLGITPANQFSLVQATETPEESQLLAGWFTQMWNALPASAEGKAAPASHPRFSHRRPRQHSSRPPRRHGPRLPSHLLPGFAPARAFCLNAPTLSNHSPPPTPKQSPPTSPPLG